MAEQPEGGLPLDLLAAIPGLKAAEVSVLIVGGLGAGVGLNAGTDNGDGTVTLLATDAARPGGLRMHFPPGASGPHTFAVTVISNDGHVKTGSLTVEPTLAAVDAGLAFAVEDPVVMDRDGEKGGRLGFPLAVRLPTGLGKMVGGLEFQLSGVPHGVHLTGGRSQGGGVWLLAEKDLGRLNLVVPDGQGAFEVVLTVVARGQSGGRVKVERTARVVPPGAVMSPAAVQAAAQAPGNPAGAAADWLTGTGVFTFASGHGGDLFEGGYGWAEVVAPADGGNTGTIAAMRLRVLASGPQIEGPDPVVW